MDVAHTSTESHYSPRYSLPKFAMMCDRLGVTSRVASCLTSALFEDIGWRDEHGRTIVCDKNKVDWERRKLRSDVLRRRKTGCLKAFSFDGRKDDALIQIKVGEFYYSEMKKESHLVVVQEPNNQLLGYVNLGGKNDSAEAKHGALKEFFEEKQIPLDNLIGICSDGEVTNTGEGRGILRRFEKQLNRALHWWICLLHFNELPFRHLYETLEKSRSTGPRTSTGSLEKYLHNCHTQQGYTLKPHEKSSMLGSIFWGSLLVQIPSGYLSSEYGTVNLLFFSVLFSSLISIVMPLSLIYGNSFVFIGLRVLQGFAQGMLFPTVFGHLAKWCPLNQRSLLGGISQTGIDAGLALGLMNSGFLVLTPLYWPAIFYIPGLVGLIWCIFCLIYGSESPHSCKYITEHELDLIQTKGTLSMREKREMAVPWCKIVTSIPYIVLVLNKISQALCIATLAQQIPIYLNRQYGYDIHLNAIISAVPFFIMLLSNYFVVFISHYLLNVRHVSLTVMRKSLNTVSNWLPAAALAMMSLLKKENVAANIVCIVVSVASYSTVTVGSSLNHIDLSPNFAALLLGITGTFFTLTEGISPIIVAEVVTDENNRWKWNIIFLSIAGFLFLTHILYLCFGQMVAQPWNELHPKHHKIPTETAATSQAVKT